MLGPDSLLLTVLLILGSAALLYAMSRQGLLPLRIVCGAMSIVVAMAGGVAAVNDYYGYYTTWGELWADVHGGTGNLGVISAAAAPALGAGRLGWIDLPGRLSGYDRRGLLYLPPQYGDPRYASVRFPVAELFHGTPGSPLTWYNVLRIGQVVQALESRHLIGPMVLVMPSINGPAHDFQDCVNGPASHDATYLASDVRADLLARYRVSSDPYAWGMTGYSSGGYCAANLALRYPRSFGAAAVIEGYFLAADGPAGIALDRSEPLEAANSPLYLAERLTSRGGPVPAFWVAAGTHDPNYRQASMFAAALDRTQQVPFFRLSAGHSASAWAAALPAALTWLWQQLASPDLRVLFHVRTPHNPVITVPVRPPAAGHARRCEPGRRPGLRCAAPLRPVTGRATPDLD